MRDLFLIWAVMLLLFGCSGTLGIGENRGYCEENGADLRDAGVCWSPWVILHNRDEANRRAYGGGGKCD